MKRSVASFLVAVALLIGIQGCKDDSLTTPPGGGNGDGNGNPVPAANFSVSTTSNVVPFTVNFTDQSSGGPTEWRWEFGDGSVSTERNPSHTFTQVGKYSVRLTASNQAGSDVEVKPSLITADVIITIPGRAVGPFWPSHTRGDCEFDGNGPRVDAFAQLLINESAGELRLRISMTATETQSDWTTGSGSREFFVSQWQYPLRYKSIIGQDFDGWTYTDNNVEYDYMPSTVMGQLVTKGDTQGNDVCNNTTGDTHAIYYLNSVRIRAGY